jgi:hypothetical protein
MNQKFWNIDILSVRQTGMLPVSFADGTPGPDLQQVTNLLGTQATSLCSIPPIAVLRENADRHLS